MIAERKRKPYEPSVLFLARKGYMLLKDRGHLSPFPRMRWPALKLRFQISDFTLRHELAVMDVKAAFSAALTSPVAPRLVEFTTWPVLNQFKASIATEPESVVKPDGFIRFHQEDCEGLFEHTFYLEVDRSSETVDTLVRKAFIISTIINGEVWPFELADHRRNIRISRFVC